MVYWMTRSLGFAAGLVMLAAFLSYALDLVFVPPSADFSSAWAPHWRAYAAFWNLAEQIGRSGLSEGLFPSVIRTFDNDGLPAFVPWAALGITLAVLAVLSLLVLLVVGPRPSQLHASGQKDSLEGTSGSAKSGLDGDDVLEGEGGLLPIPPTSIRAAPPLIRERPESAPVATSSAEATPGSPAVGSAPAALARQIESHLYESEQALATAMGCLEDVRRASLNLVLDPAVAQANQDLKEIHDALDELEMAFEQLRGQQHLLMADLVQRDGQSPAR